MQPAEDGKKAFSLRTLIGAIIFLATLCVAVVLYSHRLVQRDFEANTAFIRIATDVAQEVSIAHLRLEEAIAGKDTVDLGRDILQPIRDARARTDTGMLADRLAGADIVSTVQQDLVELRGRVDQFVDLAEARWIQRDSPLGKVGGELDRTLDEVFDDIMRRTRLLVGNVNGHIMEDRKQIFLINMGTLATLVILFLGVAALIARNRKVLDTRAAALKRLVHERTARLKSREAEAVYRSVQLEAAEKRANAASAAKSHFLASMSHEIRTPMTGVLGTTGLLARTDLTSEQREYVETLRTSGLSLLRIINEILDFSKIEAGEVTLDNVDFLLEPSINDVLHLFSAEAAQRNLKLELEIADEVPPAVHGDPVRIGQVLSNLVSNAIKFSRDGTVEVLCGLAEDQPDDAGRTQLLFAVKDHGPGISEADQARLFQEFSQLYRDPRKPCGGTGLGLAISRELVTRMGGDIGVHSVLGEGSTFWFTICMNRGDAVEALAAAPRRTAQEKAPTAYATSAGPARAAREVNGRILLVDDNEINLFVVRRMLEHLGFEVDSATNGHEAIEAASRRDYAAILIDSQMPGMDGNEATARIRRNEGPDGHTPIVALTANALPTERSQAFEAGVDDYLRKPVLLEDLEMSLRRLIGASGRGGAENACPAAAPPPPSATPDDVLIQSIAEELRQIVTNGDNTLWEELSAQFVTHVPELLEGLQTAAAQHDHEELKRQAHKVLGASRQIGASRMTRLCELLESTQECGDQALQTVGQLALEFQRVRSVLSGDHA